MTKATENKAIAHNANDVKAIETAFYKALGNGKLAATHMASLVESVTIGRDSTIVAKAIARAKDKGDDKAASVLGLAMRQVFPKMKLTNKNGVYSIKISGIDPDMKALERIKGAAQKGLSIRGATFAKAIKGDPAKEEKKFVPAEWADRASKGKTKSELQAMIAALQAKVGVNGNAKVEPDH